MSWGAVIAGGAALGSAAISRSKKGGGGGAEGQNAYDVVRLPTYDFTEPRFKAMSDFVQNQFTSIGQGELPSWLQNFLPQVQAGMEQDLNNTYYGLPGQRRRGVVQGALEGAAITGAGSGVANRAVDKQMINYADSARKIDEYIAGQKIQGTQQTIRDAGAIGLGIPQGPPAQIVQYGYPAQAPSDNSGLLSQAGSVIGTMLGNQQGGQNSGNAGYIPNLPQSQYAFPAQMPQFSGMAFPSQLPGPQFNTLTQSFQNAYSPQSQAAKPNWFAPNFLSNYGNLKLGQY